MKHLSGYRLMWMMVMFDLPVGTSEERKNATGFRNFLLDQGFEMSQFSVYIRFIGERERCAPLIRRIRAKVPENGKVSILQFTDRQFGEIISIQDRTVEKIDKIPAQLAIF